MEKLSSLAQFEQLKKEERIIFMFSADWCPDCKFIEPVMPIIEADYPEFRFVSVDRDEFTELCETLDIFGIPSFVAFHRGKEIGRFVSKARKTKEEIVTFMDELPS